ncbi:MAG: hypothetical protein FJW44_02840 [Actinobacteria bacterium]|nr:hypothetical protein [Actinomycetota bacterium]
MGRVILHIGTLKTGTTSFQRWFFDNESAITAATGCRWFHGAFPDAREIAAACIDDGRQTPAMALGFFPERGSDAWLGWRREVDRSLRSQVDAADTPILVSCEALCLLRSPTEMERLAGLFDPATTDVVLALRSPAGFLSSWKQHLEHDFFRRSNDPASFAYVATDSWLVDYDSLKDAYKTTFGGRFSVIDYDTCLARDGSIIPALTATFTGTPMDALPEWRGYHLNRSARPPRKPVRGLARPRHYLRWWRWKLSRGIRGHPPRGGTA